MTDVSGRFSVSHDLLSTILNNADVTQVTANLLSKLITCNKKLHNVEDLADDSSFRELLKLTQFYVELLQRQCKDEIELQLSSNSSSGQVPGVVVESCCAVLKDFCWPVMKECFTKESLKTTEFNFLSEVCALSACCIQFVEPGIFMDTVQLLVDTLSNFSKISSQSVLLIVIRALANIYTCFQIRLEVHITEQLLAIVQQLLLVEGDQIVSNVLTLLIPAILSSSSAESTELRQNVFTCLWIGFESCLVESNKNRNEDLTVSRQLLVLCGLLDIFFSVENMHTVHSAVVNSQILWVIVQHGCCHADSIVRKRALYILRRAVQFSSSCSPTAEFWNNSCNSVPVNSLHCLQQLKSVWNELILLIEMLEEKQVHVILPILSRFDKLIDASNSTADGIKLHTSWLVTLFRCMLSHESGVIKRWAVTTIFALDYSQCPILQQEGIEFLAGQFMSVLLEPAIYYRVVPFHTFQLVSDILRCGLSFEHVHTGRRSSCCHMKTVATVRTDESDSDRIKQLATQFKRFITNVSCNLPECNKVTFWSSFMHQLSCQNHDGSALSIVSSVMMGLPEVGVIAEVNYFRTLLSARISTLHILFRVVVQSYVLSGFTKLVNLRMLDLSDLAAVIGGINAEEISFHRGSDSWRLVIDWLQVNHKLLIENRKQSIDEFIFFSLSQWLQETADSHQVLSHCDPIVRLLLLAADAQLLPSDKQSVHSLESCLLPVFDVLQLASSHVYISKVKVERAMQVVISIVDLMGMSNAGNVHTQTIQSMAGSSAESVTMYISRSLSELRHQTSSSVPKVDSSSFNLYALFIRRLPKLVPLETCLTNSCMEKLIDTALELLSTTTDDELPLCAAMAIAAAVCSFIPCDYKSSVAHKLYQFFQTWRVVICRPAGSSDRCRGSDWSKFLENQWICIGWMISQQLPGVAQCTGLIEVAYSMLDVAGPNTLTACFKTLATLLPMASDDVIVGVLKCCWQKVIDLQLNSQFKYVYSAFVKSMYQSALIQLPEDCSTTLYLMEICEEILVLSEDKSGLLNVLVNALCSSTGQNGNNHLVKYSSFLSECLLFGPIRGKAYRLFADAHSYLSQIGSYSAERVLRGNDYDDTIVRICLIGCLTRASTNPDEQSVMRDHCCRVNQHLRSAHRKLLSKPRRCFANSQAHRQSHRLMAALLMLDTFVPDEDASAYYKHLIEVLDLETQPSVRLLIEWALIRLIYCRPNLQSDVWDLFDQTSEKKAALLCSLCLIVAQIGKLLHVDSQLVAYISAALSKLLPWCMMANFNVRTFAQASLLSLWQVANARGLVSNLTNCGVLSSMDVFLRSQRESCVTVQQLLSSFCYMFHPVDDYSVETILYTVPRLACLADDEWISAEKFIAVNRDWSSNLLPLHGKTESFQHCQFAMWKPQSSGGDVELSLQSYQLDCNLQRKMIPLRSVMACGQDVDQRHDDFQSRQPLSSSGLVLVTSLIDRPPNLGGLCRTCEIFGVSKYIIGNLRYMDDKNFETLSVTAQKWLDIEEVKPNNLRDYLLNMKSLGYTVVGAEQTTSGLKLDSYQFPKNSVLVLGNEKTGIPVELLQVLDVCVEIPQHGVIRSLNVHVSGAIFIWEYYKQWTRNSSDKRVNNV